MGQAVLQSTDKYTGGFPICPGCLEQGVQGFSHLKGLKYLLISKPYIHNRSAVKAASKLLLGKFFSKQLPDPAMKTMVKGGGLGPLSLVDGMVPFGDEGY